MRFSLFVPIGIFCAATVASAVPIVSLAPSNVGITSFGFTVVGNTITLNEVWGNNGPGFLLFSGLDSGVNYTIVKNFTNNTGVTWNRLANELLDPAGQANDGSDVLPYPGFVPAGFTTSNDDDGLSFAQGSGLPRTSTIFSSLIADEGTDVRDFLDYFNGTLASGASGSLTFGLRDSTPGENQPFLLAQRPNVDSRGGGVPEPGSYALLGTGLLLMGLVGKRRSMKSAA